MVLNRNDVRVRDFANPDVAELRRIAVVLELDRFAIAVRLVLRRAMEERVALDFPVVLDDATVQDRGDVRRADDFRDVIGAVRVFFNAENRAREDNIVGLPFGRFFDRIDVRRELLVDRAALTFEVGRVFIRVEDLQLVMVHQENTAVAATLALKVRVVDRRAREFDVKLAAAEFFFRRDRAGARFAGQFAVGDVPFAAGPVRVERFLRTVEENERVGRSVFRGFARRNDLRFRPIDTHAEVAAAEFAVLVLRGDGRNRRGRKHKSKENTFHENFSKDRIVREYGEDERPLAVLLRYYSYFFLKIKRPNRLGGEKKSRSTRWRRFICCVFSTFSISSVLTFRSFFSSVERTDRLRYFAATVFSEEARENFGVSTFFFAIFVEISAALSYT